MKILRKRMRLITGSIAVCCAISLLLMVASSGVKAIPGPTIHVFAPTAAWETDGVGVTAGQQEARQLDGIAAVVTQSGQQVSTGGFEVQAHTNYWPPWTDRGNLPNIGNGNLSGGFIRIIAIVQSFTSQQFVLAAYCWESGNPTAEIPTSGVFTATSSYQLYSFNVTGTLLFAYNIGVLESTLGGECWAMIVALSPVSSNFYVDYLGLDYAYHNNSDLYTPPPPNSTNSTNSTWATPPFNWKGISSMIGFGGLLGLIATAPIGIALMRRADSKGVVFLGMLLFGAFSYAMMTFGFG